MPSFMAIMRTRGSTSMLIAAVNPDEISILVRDEGQGFDVDRVPDPMAPENIQHSWPRNLSDESLHR